MWKEIPNVISAITGKTDWTLPPRITLENAADRTYVDTQIATISASGIPKLNSYSFGLGAATAGQRQFTIPMDIFDSNSDTLMVWIGSSYTSPNDYVITNTVHNAGGAVTARGYFTLNDTAGVVVGTIIDIVILKNVPIGADGSINGASLAIGSVPFNRVIGINQSMLTTDTVSFKSVTLTQDPVTGNQATTKTYVDSQISSVSASGIPKLNSYPFTLAAATTGQRQFTVPMDLFDSNTDTLMVWIGSTYTAPTEYVITNTVHGVGGAVTARGYFTLNDTAGVDANVVVDIIVLKNVPIGTDGSINGSSLAVGSVPLNRVQGIQPTDSVTFADATLNNLAINGNISKVSGGQIHVGALGTTDIWMKLKYDGKIAKGTGTDAVVWNEIMTMAGGSFLGPVKTQIGSTNGLHIEGMAIGFNRNTSNGVIYDSTKAAFQIHNDGILHIQTYNGAGASITENVIDGSGNIGIKTSQPYETFHVVGGIRSQGKLYNSIVNKTMADYQRPTGSEPDSFGGMEFYQDSTQGYKRFLDIYANGHSGAIGSVVRILVQKANDAVTRERARFTEIGLGLGWDPTELLQVGGENTTDSAARKVIRIGSGGFGAPGNYDTSSNGDKIILFHSSAASYDGRIGVGTTQNMWFKSSGPSGQGAFEFFTGGPTLTRRLLIDSSGLTITGNYSATGTKSAIVQTETHGEQFLFAVESPENRFEDFGEATIGANGDVTVNIDPIFLETVETLNGEYYVFIQGIDGSTYKITSRLQTNFTVKGDPNTSFMYRIVAWRKGYKNLRFNAAKSVV